MKPTHTSPGSATCASVRLDLTRLDGVLPENEVHVWHTDLAAQKTAISAYSELLDADEQHRASRFIVAAPRVQFILSRAFLRIALGQYLGVHPRDVRFRTAKHGKPELAANTDLRFNLSHTEGTTVIAITRGRRVGVDVERIRENVDPVELGDRFFSQKEAEWLRSQPASERFSAFFACWAAKESYIKAWGEGLSMPLAGFGVIPRGGNTKLELEVYSKPEASRGWSVWQLDLGPGLRSAVAVEEAACSIRIGQWFPQDVVGNFLRSPSSP
ncbi:MAG: 4'-phosphopantetheinyl transferase superfamily protein [Acidobacteriia bacterium]|nr:4'-phosphopantetheinyl transferase superfamily protein [Terriglobia bacterium]